ncbi:MAG: hypothetical protein WCV85_06245 [Patescibacteria group bacterium]|jgi:hypothetical protein
MVDWKKIGGAFYKGDDDDKSSDPQKTQLPPGARPTYVPRQSNQTSGVVPRSVTTARRSQGTKAPADFDQYYFQKILENIGSRVKSPQGFDQLIQLALTMATTMASVPLEQRIDMALATVGPTTGLTKEIVIKTLRDQLTAMSEVQKIFAEDTQQDAINQKAEHAKKKQELERLKSDLEQDLRDLQTKLDDTTQKLQAESNAVSSVDTQLELDRQAFTSACEAVKQGAPSNNWFGIAILLDLLEGGHTEGSANG